MDWRVGKIVSLAEGNYARIDEAWLLAEAGKAVNLSGSRLRHVFKAETGFSVGQFLRYLRLERARELLESSRLTIKEVMAEAGFKDKSHFCRDFENAFGITPFNYRSQFLRKTLGMEASRLTSSRYPRPERALSAAAKSANK